MNHYKAFQPILNRSLLTMLVAGLLAAGSLARGQNSKSQPAPPAGVAQIRQIKVVAPSLENVGQVRQSRTPAAGNTYWMAFSNQGRPIKPGDRVDIEIGQFQVQGLLVQ